MDRDRLNHLPVVDNPGPNGSEHLYLEGEAKRRRDVLPSRFLIGVLIIVGFFTLFGAAALAGDRLIGLEARYAAEARR